MDPSVPRSRLDVEQLYRQYGFAVLRRARAILRSEAEAREAMQDVFVTVLTRGDSFRGDSSPMTWLYAVTSHLCLNRLRDKKRQQALLAERAEGSQPSEGPDPERAHAVRELLSSVPEAEARAAVYLYFDDLSHEEIAALMGCSRRKVGGLLERFRARLLAREARA
jgi:RNA polymerase sigma factor (sigma-70 family)